jgi:hypothetical protein
VHELALPVQDDIDFSRLRKAELANPQEPVFRHLEEISERRPKEDLWLSGTELTSFRGDRNRDHLIPANIKELFRIDRPHGWVPSAARNL